MPSFLLLATRCVAVPQRTNPRLRHHRPPVPLWLWGRRENQTLTKNIGNGANQQVNTVIYQNFKVVCSTPGRPFQECFRNQAADARGAPTIAYALRRCCSQAWKQLRGN